MGIVFRRPGITYTSRFPNGANGQGDSPFLTESDLAARIFATRAEFVAALNSGLVDDNGKVVVADGLFYKFSSGATSISDMPGVVPVGDVYPDHFGENTSQGVTDMTSALQAAITYASGSCVFLRGDEYRITSRITISQPTQIIGKGMRQGATRLVFTGAGAATLETRMLHPSDGTDAAMTIAILVNSAYVYMRDLIIVNKFSGSDPYGTWGSNIDVGIMVKSKTAFQADRVRTEGYWNQAGIWYDVTVDGGNCDRSVLRDCWFQGFWGMRVAGPIPQSPFTDAQVGDVRGSGGMSDFLAHGCVFNGTNHFSSRRRSDTDGGCLKMDGRINNWVGRLSGHKFDKCRFATAEPYIWKLDYISRVEFDSAHVERVTGYTKASDGVTGVGGADVLVNVSANARNVQIRHSDFGNVTKDWSAVRGVITEKWNNGSGNSTSYSKDNDNYIEGSLEWNTQTPTHGPVRNGGFAWSRIAAPVSSDTGIRKFLLAVRMRSHAVQITGANVLADGANNSIRLNFVTPTSMRFTMATGSTVSLRPTYTPTQNWVTHFISCDFTNAGGAGFGANWATDVDGSLLVNSSGGGVFDTRSVPGSGTDWGSRVLTASDIFASSLALFTNGNGQPKFNGEIAYVWLDYGNAAYTLLDVHNSTVRDSFAMANINVVDGSGPTGAKPKLFLTGAPAQFNSAYGIPNRGSLACGNLIVQEGTYS